MTLPLNYAELETGDVIHFPLINNTKAFDIDYDWDAMADNGYDFDIDDKPTEDDIEVIVFKVKYGQQDDCHNTTHSVDMKVRRDVLNQWGGNGLPQLEE